MQTKRDVISDISCLVFFNHYNRLFFQIFFIRAFNDSLNLSLFSSVICLFVYLALNYEKKESVPLFFFYPFKIFVQRLPNVDRLRGRTNTGIYLQQKMNLG